MEKTYWTLFALGSLGFFLSLLLIVALSILLFKKLLSKKYFIISTGVLLFALLLSLYLVIPCIKDYRYISNGDFFEEDAIVIEFTYVHHDLDGTGEIQYSKPKFYIENQEKYVVLKVSNVEIGKKYRIKYLPNTKIGEVLFCIE